VAQHHRPPAALAAHGATADTAGEKPVHECVICGDYEAEHTPANVDPARRCRVRNYYGCGRNEFVVCECPGYQPQQEDAS
jgi:hypothetical protein